MQKYLVIFEKAKENYSAYKEAINYHLDGLKEDGLPLPEPSSFTEYVEV
jgi:predicted RNase H-like HicB family nuclease